MPPYRQQREILFGGRDKRGKNGGRWDRKAGPLETKSKDDSTYAMKTIDVEGRTPKWRLQPLVRGRRPWPGELEPRPSRCRGRPQSRRVRRQGETRTDVDKTPRPTAYLRKGAAPPREVMIRESCKNDCYSSHGRHAAIFEN